MLPLRHRVREERASSKASGIFNVDEPVLYISNGEEELPLYEAAKGYVDKDTKQAPFHASGFYKHTGFFLFQLHTWHEEVSSEQDAMFTSFMAKVLYQTTSNTHSNEALFFAVMTFFDFNEREMSKEWESRAVMRVKRLLWRVNGLFHLETSTRSFSSKWLFREETQPSLPTKHLRTNSISSAMSQRKELELSVDDE